MGPQGGLTHERGSTFPPFPYGNALDIYDSGTEECWL